MRRPVLAAVAALSMIVGTSPALAQSAAPLSVAAHVGPGADMSEASNYRGGFIIPTLIVLGLVALIYVLTKDGEVIAARPDEITADIWNNTAVAGLRFPLS